MRSAKRSQSSSAKLCWNSQMTAALWALEDGIESDALAEKLTKLYGKEYGRKIVDTASVRLWLAEEVPPSDAITMLECRRQVELSPCDCRTYAIEILLNVREAMRSEDGPLVSSRREPHHAAA